ncbi:MAG: DUF2088 domain-containing protein [Deltaproteobacteria bacterium]|nr:DUF2088 domain-containing protein [Deltaproteobacteria bacterium]
MQTEIVFGDRFIGVNLPDDTVFPSPGIGASLPVATDLEVEIRRALAEPLDTPPLRDNAKPGARVTIAFDDPTVAQYAPLWSTAFPLVLAELDAAGVRRDDVRLLCANALHRMFTHGELATILGDDIVREFAPRLTCHDAEDPDGIVALGQTPSGLYVDLNRAVVESDLTIYLNCSTYRGFSGGWKSICVGLSTFRSIHHHHNPTDMSMSFDRNRMHAMLDEMGALVVEKLGRDRIFKIETVQANPLQVSRVLSGTVDATRREALSMLRAHQAPRRDLVTERVDIVVYGVPAWSPYAAFATMNPILTLVSTGLGYLGGVIEAFGKPGCSVVLATPCPVTWDDVHHPSYREVWERVLPETHDPDRAQALFESDFATRRDYVEKYRFANGFHGAHGLMAIYPLKRLRHAGRVIVAGAEDPSVARHLGFESAPTVEAAIDAARAIHGPSASIACVKYPPAFNRAK